MEWGLLHIFCNKERYQTPVSCLHTHTHTHTHAHAHNIIYIILYIFILYVCIFVKFIMANMLNDVHISDAHYLITFAIMVAFLQV